MARGWESKSIESQQDAAEERRNLQQREQLSPEEAERQQKRESLLLSRARVAHDLENATSPRYRETLQAALTHLDAKLAEL